MNEIPIIRKGTFKDYFKPGCILGVFIGGLAIISSLVDRGYSLLKTQKKEKKCKKSLIQSSFCLFSL